MTAKWIVKSRWMAVAAIALTLCACESIGNPVLKQETASSVSLKISKGISTKDQVHQAYGDPDDISLPNGDAETWRYQYSHATLTAVSYVPIVGRVFGGRDVQKRQLVIRFDKSGVVSDYKMLLSNEDVRRGTSE